MSYEDALDPIAAQSIDYWLALVPGLSIGAYDAANVFNFSPSHLDDLNEELRHEGYVKVERLVEPELTATLAAAVKILVQRGWPATFAFVFDETWQIFVRLQRLLGAFLGDGYCTLPALWAWHVDPRDDQRGWRPHRDRPSPRSLRDDKQPTIMTAWVALTDATPLNGCIYVIPAHLYEGYVSGPDKLVFEPHYARALPAPAGSVLLWSHNLVHWGGQSSRKAPEPRISLSVEFQSSDCEPFADPLMDSSTIPTFPRRLSLIGEAICRYTHMYGKFDPLYALGKTLQGE